MAPGLHFLLIRFGHYLSLAFGVGMTVWFWNDGVAEVLFLFLIPGLVGFFFLQGLLTLRLHASCPGCSSPVQIGEKKRTEEIFEYVYRCEACTHQHPTGVLFRREAGSESQSEQLPE